MHIHYAGLRIVAPTICGSGGTRAREIASMNSETYNCTYELREGEQIVATGRVTLTEPPQTGSTLRLGARVVVIEDAVPLGREYRLVLRDD